MITEDYVSFEAAKLLKEKGFVETSNTIGTYNNKGKFFLYGHEKGYNHNRLSTWYSAPTLQMAMKWLREVYKLYITISHRFSHNADQDVCFSYYVNVDKCQDGEFMTYEEACEAAIKYCLENLI